MSLKFSYSPIHCRVFCMGVLLYGLVCLLPCVTLAKEPADFRFHTFTSAGYYQGISTIAKDRDGLIWFGAEGALVCFDGYTFADKNHQIGYNRDSHRYFTRIHAGADSLLYIATNQGLFVLNKEHNQASNPLKDYVEFVTTDSRHTVWLITHTIPCIYDIEQNKLTPIQFQKHNIAASTMLEYEGGMWVAGNQGSLFECGLQDTVLRLRATLPIQDKVVRIAIDDNHIFMLTSRNGLFRLSSTGQVVQHYPLNPGGGQSALAKDLYYDTLRQTLWVATQTGLFLVDIPTGNLRILRHSPAQKYSLPHNSIWSLYPDPDGGLWLGMYGGNLSYMSPSDNPFELIQPTIVQEHSLSNGIVSSFAQDSQGVLWIGTEGGGLNKYTDQGGVHGHIEQHEQGGGISYNHVKCLRYDPTHGILWLGMYKGGLNTIDTRTGRIHNLGIEYNVYSMAHVGADTVYVSDPNKGVALFDTRTKTLKNIALPKEAAITEMMLDAQGNLWCAGRKGLYIIDSKTQQLKRTYKVGAAPLGLSSNWLYCIKQLSTGEVWIGTNGQGITVVDTAWHTRHIGAGVQGLPSTIYAIEEDTLTRSVWMSSDQGVVRYAQTTQEFQLFDIEAESPQGAFYPNSSFISAQHQVFFGRTNGFIKFFPSQIHPNPFEPTAVITRLLVDNEEWVDSSHPAERLVLRYNQNNLKFYFASNSYLYPSKNKFAYKMEGVDSKWRTMAAGEHQVEYSQLPPGTYALYVKAANNDGVWGAHTTALVFTIKPPFWLSLWAYLLYTLVVVALIYLIWRYLASKKDYEHNLAIARLEKDKIEEINKLKVDFFTQISHELRTPLTLIADPATRLLHSTPSHAPGYNLIRIIERNTKKLYLLINQLLEFRKIESRYVTVHKEEGELITFLQALFECFAPLADNKGIITTFKTTVAEYHTSFDKDIMEKIFSNLLSNAVKYTLPEEHITMQAQVADNHVEVSVMNSGVELTPEQEKSLFDSFYRINHPYHVLEKGTGLGLAIVKELTSLIHARLTHSYLDGVLCLSVTLDLPLLSKAIDKVPETPYGYARELADVLETRIVLNEDNGIHPETLLIVEDSQSLRDYLAQLLQDEYNILIAANGEQGLEMARLENPSLVLSDVMMPFMDGITMCSILKEDIETSHIPVVLLTALNSMTNKMDGLKKGVDVYIEKPFDSDYLRIQIRNLIRTRQNIRQAFSKSILPDIEQMQLGETDSGFLKKAYEFVVANLDNGAYDVEQFVKDMAMSRTALYKKVKVLTGMSIKEFVIDLRLKRAAELLSKTRLSISEVAYQVGFNDTRYFSTVFKKHFDQTPTEYLAMYRK